MEDGNYCDINLSLTIGCYDDHVMPKRDNKGENSCVTYLDPSLPNEEEAIEDMEDDNGEGSNSIIIYEDVKQIGKSSSSSNKDEIEKEIGKNGVRKKLMLTREQSKFLEEKFKYHPTPTMTQKQVIAAKLNLKTRQVEVWFQNRRARTKLKKIETDYELLKKCCDSLCKENKRLKRELQELRYLMFRKQNSSLLMKLAKVSKMTSSCEKIMKNKEKQ